MDELLRGPGFDAEMAYRRERVAALWGRSAWADRVVDAARRRRAHRADHRAEHRTAAGRARP